MGGTHESIWHCRGKSIGDISEGKPLGICFLSIKYTWGITQPPLFQSKLPFPESMIRTFAVLARPDRLGRKLGSHAGGENCRLLDHWNQQVFPEPGWFMIEHTRCQSGASHLFSMNTSTFVTWSLPLSPIYLGRGQGQWMKGINIFFFTTWRVHVFQEKVTSMRDLLFLSLQKQALLFEIRLSVFHCFHWILLPFSFFEEGQLTILKGWWTMSGFKEWKGRDWFGFSPSLCVLQSSINFEWWLQVKG